MDTRQLGAHGPHVSLIGYGAFKIGRNQQTKYGSPFELPTEAESAYLLNAVLDLGINYIDTAPSYGLSESRIGRAIGHRAAEFVLSTKVGETFENGQSRYDYSSEAIRSSLEISRQRLRRDVLDIVFVHAHADDLAIQIQTDVVETLQLAREQGWIRWLGFSAKTLNGARHALQWADMLMLEYHLSDTSLLPVIRGAAGLGKGVVVKKALAAGQLPPTEALRFVLRQAEVATTVVSTLNLAHLSANIAAVTGL